MEAIYRSDGKIGFKFTSAGQRLFVLRLTDEGKRIFGWNHRYVALDANKQFTPYLDEDGEVISTLPTPNLTESIVCVTKFYFQPWPLPPRDCGAYVPPSTTVRGV